MSVSLLVGWRRGLTTPACSPRPSPRPLPIHDRHILPLFDIDSSPRETNSPPLPPLQATPPPPPPPPKVSTHSPSPLLFPSTPLFENDTLVCVCLKWHALLFLSREQLFNLCVCVCFAYCLGYCVLSWRRLRGCCLFGGGGGGAC